MMEIRAKRRLKLNDGEEMPLNLLNLNSQIILDSHIERNTKGIYRFIYRNCFILPIVFLLFIISSNSLGQSRVNASDKQKGQLINDSLVGIIFSRKPSLSIAVLRNDNTGETLIYKQDDNISGLVIKQIHKNKIILQDGESSIQLFLENGITSEPTNESQAEVKNHESVNLKEHSSWNSLENSKLYREEYFSFETSKAIMNEWPHIISETRFEHFYEGGKLKGYRITQLPLRSTISEVGILENDIIYMINGIEVADITDFAQFIEKCRNSNQIKVRVKRENLIYSLIFVVR